MNDESDKESSSACDYGMEQDVLECLIFVKTSGGVNSNRERCASIFVHAERTAVRVCTCNFERVATSRRPCRSA